MLLRPAPVPPGRRGWLPLLAGVAVVSAVRAVAGVAAVLKWPNDVLVGERKLAGILAEQSPDGSAVVIGIGLNVATPAEALPVSPAGLPATSLLAEGAAVSRETLLLAILGQLEALVPGVPRRPRPGARPACSTPTARCAPPWARQVRVELPAGRVRDRRRPRDIDPDGRLLIAGNFRRIAHARLGRRRHPRPVVNIVDRWPAPGCGQRSTLIA